MTNPEGTSSALILVLIGLLVLYFGLNGLVNNYVDKEIRTVLADVNGMNDSKKFSNSSRRSAYRPNYTRDILIESCLFDRRKAIGPTWVGTVNRPFATVIDASGVREMICVSSNLSVLR
jgi:hypothetical protein